MPGSLEPARRSMIQAQPLPSRSPSNSFDAARLLVAVIVAVGVSWLLKGPIEGAQLSKQTITVAAVFGTLFGTVLVVRNPVKGLALFVALACISPRTEGNIRLEDMLVPGLFFGWMGRNALGARTRARSMLSTPIILATVTMIGATIAGLMGGTVPEPAQAVFVVGKRLEYYFLFVMAFNVIRTHEEARTVLEAFIVGAVAVAIVSLGHISPDPNTQARVQGLDEGNYNTLSGFLVIAIPLAVAGWLHYGDIWQRIGYGISAAIMSVVLLMSYSREGYFILVLALLVLALMRYRALVPALVGVALLGALVRNPFVERFIEAVEDTRNYKTETVGGNSLTARVSGWEWRWNQHVVNRPLMGAGAGSVPFSVDNEYLLRLIESGTLGLAAFLAVLVTCWRSLRKAALQLRGTNSEPYAWGLLAAFAGLLLQGMVAATFSTIRTMEPFWVLVGVVGALAAKAPVLHGGRLVVERKASYART
jgi:hypothetical protein